MATRVERTAACLAGVVFLCAAPTLQAADRALLVGLDRYGHPDVPGTPGGTADAKSMVRTLRSELGFAAADIEVLLDEQATSKAVLDRFEHWLIQGTEPGDRVFFLYAGHGSQLADLDGDEDDGFDETLAPFDVNPDSGEGQIRDDVLDGLIARLSGRRAVLLFDSCHSGTLTRSVGGAFGGGGVRFLPRSDQRLPTMRGGGYKLEAAPGGDPRPFDRPTTRGRSDGIVAISAAGPGQLAYPIDVDGQPRGALTYLFQQTVSMASWVAAGADENAMPGSPSLARSLWQDLGKEMVGMGSEVISDAVGDAVKGKSGKSIGADSIDDLKQGISVAVLESLIDQGMKKLQDSGRLEGSQEPFFEVLSERPLEEQPLFGDWQEAGAAAMANPVDNRRVTLRTKGNRALFMAGESLVAHVGTDRPGYLYLLVFSEQEKATCVFPNRLDRQNSIAAGELTVPTHEGYRLPVKEPFGRDLIVALVADAPLPLCDRQEYRWRDIFEQVKLDEIHAQLKQEIRRGVGVQATSQGSDTVPGWQTATLEIHTVAGDRR